MRKLEGSKPKSNLIWQLIHVSKKCFYKSTSNKMRAKENLCPLLDVGGNIVEKKDEGKTEVLYDFFASVFNNRTRFIQVSRLLIWKRGMRSRMKPS